MNEATGHRETARMMRNPDVLHSRSGDVTVALYVESGDCFSFTGPSARIWELLETPISAREIAAQLVGEFAIDDDACLAETLAFLDDLRAEGLVRPAEAG